VRGEGFDVPEPRRQRQTSQGGPGLWKVEGGDVGAGLRDMLGRHTGPRGAHLVQVGRDVLLPRFVIPPDHVHEKKGSSGGEKTTDLTEEPLLRRKLQMMDREPGEARSNDSTDFSTYPSMSSTTHSTLGHAADKALPSSMATAERSTPR